MDYINYKRFKGKAICGEVNLPALTNFKKLGNMITYENKPICVSTSQNAHDYFARNDDGQGLYRGKLITEIKTKLAKRDDDYQKRWNKIWEDENCKKYKRVEHADFWLWNDAFFNAPIEDLVYIANLIGIKETKL